MPRTVVRQAITAKWFAVAAVKSYGAKADAWQGLRIRGR